MTESPEDRNDQDYTVDEMVSALLAETAATTESVSEDGITGEEGGLQGKSFFFILTSYLGIWNGVFNGGREESLIDVKVMDGANTIARAGNIEKDFDPPRSSRHGKAAFTVANMLNLSWLQPGKYDLDIKMLAETVTSGFSVGVLWSHCILRCDGEKVWEKALSAPQRQSPARFQERLEIEVLPKE